MQSVEYQYNNDNLKDDREEFLPESIIFTFMDWDTDRVLCTNNPQIIKENRHLDVQFFNVRLRVFI